MRLARAEIEKRSVDVQTELISGSLESEEARRFLASMPTAEALMPAAPSVAEIETAAAKLQAAIRFRARPFRAS